MQSMQGPQQNLGCAHDVTRGCEQTSLIPTLRRASARCAYRSRK
jgi:hypothetical protein